jgi:hypothetical protein
MLASEHFATGQAAGDQPVRREVRDDLAAVIRHADFLFDAGSARAIRRPLSRSSTRSRRTRSCAARRKDTWFNCARRLSLRRRRFHGGLSGDMMRMPGLPKVPASDGIDIDADGNIVGLA